MQLNRLVLLAGTFAAFLLTGCQQQQEPATDVTEVGKQAQMRARTLGQSPAGSKAGRIPVEHQVRAVADNFPTPFDTPLAVIERITAEGPVLSRTLRLKTVGMKQSFNEAPAKLRKSMEANQQAEHSRALCSDAATRQLLDAGGIFDDRFLFGDGSDFFRVRTDRATCLNQKKGYDFSGTGGNSADITARIQAVADQMKTPVNAGVGTFTDVKAHGPLLRRTMQVNLVVTAAQFDQSNQDAYIRQLCANAFLAQLFLDGGQFEDTLINPRGEVFAVLTTDRAACHRVTR